MADKKRCFVVMGFGKKTDYVTGRVFDLDKSYRLIIKRAAEEAGLECIRADDMVHAGVIDKPIYQMLLEADVVVADLTTSNATAIYQLGVRHALRPNTTIVIAETNFKFPFDIKALLIRYYEHLGEGIDVEEAEHMRHELTKALLESVDSPGCDSPVYTFLRGLKPPVASDSDSAVVERFPSGAKGVAASGTETVATLMAESEKAIEVEDWATARASLQLVRSIKGSSDPYVLQRLALATYKSRTPTQQEAIEAALEILAPLAGSLNDADVLSMWGAIHKRRWELAADQVALETAISAYQKALSLRPTYKDGIALAFMLNARACDSDRAEGISDFVVAQRVRRDVISLCNGILEDSRSRKSAVPDEYSLRATLAEAWFGLGDDVMYASELKAANAIAPHPSLRDATEDRIAQLRLLLDFSPIQYLVGV